MVAAWFGGWYKLIVSELLLLLLLFLFSHSITSYPKYWVRAWSLVQKGSKNWSGRIPPGEKVEPIQIIPKNENKTARCTSCPEHILIVASNTRKKVLPSCTICNLIHNGAANDKQNETKNKLKWNNWNEINWNEMDWNEMDWIKDTRSKQLR